MNVVLWLVRSIFTPAWMLAGGHDRWPWNIFPGANSQNLAQTHRISQKSQNASFWQRQTWSISDHAINGIDPVINTSISRPKSQSPEHSNASVSDCGSSLGPSHDGIEFSQQLVTLDSLGSPEARNHVECADRPPQGIKQFVLHGIVPLSG